MWTHIWFGATLVKPLGVKPEAEITWNLPQVKRMFLSPHNLFVHPEMMGFQFVRSGKGDYFIHSFSKTDPGSGQYSGVVHCFNFMGITWLICLKKRLKHQSLSLVKSWNTSNHCPRWGSNGVLRISYRNIGEPQKVGCLSLIKMALPSVKFHPKEARNAPVFRGGLCWTKQRRPSRNGSIEHFLLGSVLVSEQWLLYTPVASGILRWNTTRLPSRSLAGSPLNSYRDPKGK